MFVSAIAKVVPMRKACQGKLSLSYKNVKRLDFYGDLLVVPLQRETVLYFVDDGLSL
jgi:hypothetical protein